MTEVRCRLCKAGPIDQPRNGQLRAFCSPTCRQKWHNERRDVALRLLDMVPDMIADLRALVPASVDDELRRLNTLERLELVANWEQSR